MPVANLKSHASRHYWFHIYQTTLEVSSWPEWKRSGLQIESKPIPRYTLKRYAEDLMSLIRAAEKELQDNYSEELEKEIRAYRYEYTDAVMSFSDYLKLIHTRLEETEETKDRHGPREACSNRFTDLERLIRLARRALEAEKGND